MKLSVRTMSYITAAAMVVSLSSAAAMLVTLSSAALAQTPPDECGPGSVPTYTTWQTGWNDWHYDANHVMLGTVGNFAAYRLTLLNEQGDSQVVDLKPGTAIFPTGHTPSAGEHVAIVGYWSQGTFIADRVILRP